MGEDWRVEEKPECWTEYSTKKKKEGMAKRTNPGAKAKAQNPPCRERLLLPKITSHIAAVRKRPNSSAFFIVSMPSYWVTILPLFSSSVSKISKPSSPSVFPLYPIPH